MATQTGYDIEALKSRGHGNGPELGGQGIAGLYRHPETGQEVVTKWDPLFLDAQSNAFERMGFVRISDAPAGYEKPIEMQAVAAAAAGAESLASLTARLDQYDRERKETQNELERLRKENAAGAKTDSTAVQESVQAAKEDAAQNVADRGQGDATDQVGDPGVRTDSTAVGMEEPNAGVEDSTQRAEREAKELEEAQAAEDEDIYAKDLEKLNHSQLDRVAELENVDFGDDDKNKKEKVAAIKEARESGDTDKESENK